MDQRNVRHTRDVPPKRVVDLLLARGIDQVIVAPNDMRDAHVVVVDYDGEHVSRIAVAAQENEVVEVLVLPDHAALNLVLYYGFSGLRRPEPDSGLHAGWGFRSIAVAPHAVVKASSTVRA